MPDNTPSEEAPEQAAQALPADASQESSSQEDSSEDKLKQELDAERERASKLEAKLRDKGRQLKQAKDSSQPEYVTRDEMWERDHKDEIELVKPDYEKILEDGYQGEKVSKSVALALALKQVPSWNDAQKKRQDDMATPSHMKRDSTGTVEVSSYGKRLGLTPERKKEILKDNPDLARL